MTLNVLFCRHSLRISQVFKYWQYRTEIVRILRRQVFRQIVQIERRRADAAFSAEGG